MKIHLHKMDVLADDMRGTRQRVASLEQDARQPRLAMEADGPSDTKTRERTKGAAKAVQAMHEDSFFCEPDRSRPDVLDQFRCKS